VAQGFEPLHGALCQFKELPPVFGIEAEHGHLLPSPLKTQKSSITVSKNSTNATYFFLSLVDAPQRPALVVVVRDWLADFVGKILGGITGEVRPHPPFILVSTRVRKTSEN
jgi:hypothetical protein